MRSIVMAEGTVISRELKEEEIHSVEFSENCMHPPTVPKYSGGNPQDTDVDAFSGRPSEPLSPIVKLSFLVFFQKKRIELLDEGDDRPVQVEQVEPVSTKGQDNTTPTFEPLSTKAQKDITPTFFQQNGNGKRDDMERTLLLITKVMKKQPETCTHCWKERRKTIVMNIHFGTV